MSNSQIVDFTIVCTAFGNRYKKFVPGWWESINSLEMQPKEVVVVHNPEDDTGVINLPVTLIENKSKDLTTMINVGLNYSKTKWIGVLSLDDRYLPNALNEVNDAENYEIIAINGISKSSGKFIYGSFDKLSIRKNTMLGSSFFTKEIYLRVGGWPKLIWSDWGFWWLCSISGARACNPPTSHIYIDDFSEDRYSNKSSSGADREMDRFMKRFW